MHLGVDLTLEAHFTTRRLSTHFSGFTGGGGGVWSKQTYVNRFFQGPRQCTYSDCKVPGVPGRCCNGKIPAAQSTLQYQVVSSLGSFKFTFVSYLKLPIVLLYTMNSYLYVSFYSMHHLAHNNLVFFAVLPSIFDYLLSFQTGCNYLFCLSLSHLQVSLT